MKAKQRLLFFIQSCLKPREVGAVSPSSSFLAKAMAKEIAPEKMGDLTLELGGGTGSLTRGLLLHGIDPKKLMIIEKNPVMALELRKKFPDCDIKEFDAQSLEALAKKESISLLSSIVSGLPLRSLPKTVRDNILNSAFSLLAYQGRFIQFTYGFKSPVPEELLLKHQIKILKKVWIFHNFPPATVWVYEKG